MPRGTLGRSARVFSLYLLSALDPDVACLEPRHAPERGVLGKDVKAPEGGVQRVTAGQRVTAIVPRSRAASILSIIRIAMARFGGAMPSPATRARHGTRDRHAPLHVFMREPPPDHQRNMEDRTMEMQDYLQKIEDTSQKIAWLRDHELKFSNVLATNILSLERHLSRLLELFSSYHDIVEDKIITMHEWNGFRATFDGIVDLLEKMRDLYIPIKEDVDLLDSIGTSATRCWTTIQYVTDVSFYRIPIDGVDCARDNFFVVNEAEASTLLDCTFRLFNRDDPDARQAPAVDIEIAARELGKLCWLVEPFLSNPTVVHYQVPPVFLQAKGVATRLKSHLKNILFIVNENFFEEDTKEIQGAMNKILAKEEFAKNSEVKLATLFGIKKDYEAIQRFNEKIAFLV